MSTQSETNQNNIKAVKEAINVIDIDNMSEVDSIRVLKFALNKLEELKTGSDADVVDAIQRIVLKEKGVKPFASDGLTSAPSLSAFEDHINKEVDLRVARIVSLIREESDKSKKTSKDDK